MKILVTDSGVGGLSVCAYAESYVRRHPFGEPVRLIFVNAAPENDYGYNSMRSKAEKLETFERFLRRVTERYAPDSIYVACNTLSVLLPEVPFMRNPAVPVKGIVETGAGLLLSRLRRDDYALIFGTVTTVGAATYPRILTDRGVPAARIISQACPGLADTISEDREGAKTAAEIRGFVRSAVDQIQTAEPTCVAYLACTHYGYRADLFAAAFRELGVRAEVLDPNEHAVQDLFGATGGIGDVSEAGIEVEVVSRYRIPDATLEAVSYYLGDIGPSTVEALRSFTCAPDLF